MQRSAADEGTSGTGRGCDEGGTFRSKTSEERSEPRSEASSENHNVLNVSSLELHVPVDVRSSFSFVLSPFYLHFFLTRSFRRGKNKNTLQINLIKDTLTNLSLESTTSPSLGSDLYPSDSSNAITPKGFQFTPDLVISTAGRVAVLYNPRSAFFAPHDLRKLKKGGAVFRERWLESLGWEVVVVEWWEWGEEEEENERMLKEKVSEI